ncbi:c-type cytochrome [Synoicihabitans lomoniglobus]|uniref:Cytochrome c domain-containing protein n=1 Tax=Synoicihabitans lomoniglobus TaxID=2909285 RepID=A0AAF0CRA9_9BACT|nr:hypothetical protein [Opitutaceae bacterium LMO-M01]WED66618.1 hypothetical protein PXH66_07115 [Opitutaceae bacterium LMO-M01]
MGIGSVAAAGLELTTAPTADDDLAVSGTWVNVPAGEIRFIARSALAKLPGVKTVTDRIWPTAKPVEMTVLPLQSLIDALGWGEASDGLVLKCGDRWESWMPQALIESENPFLILYYQGRAPGDGEGWPTFLGIEPMAPYYAFVSPNDRPDFVDATPFGMISATQIVEIAAANEAERYAPFFAGALAELSGDAADGRDLFLARCNNCHQGPGETGGNVSQRPFMLLQVHATVNADYFRKMVRDPKQFYPETIMPRHPDFEDEHFAQLIAFLAATKAAKLQ